MKFSRKLLLENSIRGTSLY